MADRFDELLDALPAWRDKWFWRGFACGLAAAERQDLLVHFPPADRAACLLEALHIVRGFTPPTQG